MPASPAVHKRTIRRESIDQMLPNSIEFQFLFSVSAGCQKAREQFEKCREYYAKLAQIVPAGQYYRYSDHWHFLSQRIVFLIALTVFLEAGFLVTRDTAASILGCK